MESSTDRTPEEAAPPGRTRKPAEERKREIVEATLEILAGEGMHGWTTSALADRVGVSEATLFKHFESKEEILKAAIAHSAARVRRRLLAYRASGDTWRDVRGLVLDVLDFMEESGGGPVVIIAGLSGDVPPETRAHIRESRKLLVERIHSFREEDSSVPAHVSGSDLADLAMAVSQSSALRWLIGGRQGSPRDIAEPMLDVLGRTFREAGGSA